MCNLQFQNIYVHEWHLFAFPSPFPCGVEYRNRRPSSLFCTCNRSVAISTLLRLGLLSWYEGKLFRLLRFITGLWSPSSLLTRKRLLINFPFWGEVHWIAPSFSPKVLSTWFIFAWRRSEFWLGNFENSRLITEFLDF